MNRKNLPSLILVLSFVLSACVGLLPLDEEPAAGNYGPAYSPAEYQTKTFEALWEKLQDNYIYYESADVDWDSVRDSYLKRIKAGLTNDEFTDLLKELNEDLPEASIVRQSRAERIAADIEDTSTYEGIGAFVGFSEEPAPHIILLAIIEGSPAQQAGLKAHDSIFAIDGNPILLKEGLNAVDRIRGPAGSSLTLDVQSPGKAEHSIEVTRGELTGAGKLEAYQIPGTKYGYMLFPPLGSNGLLEDVMTNLQTFTTNQTLDGLILDLRVAGSSLGWPLEGLLTMFEDGAIGEFYNRADVQEVSITGKDTYGSQSVPLIVLVGQNTSGSAEIFAASLQARGRATIIGANTPGAIETSSSYYLPDGSRLFVETGSFRLPNGEEIGINGIKPDVQIEAGWDEILPNADPVLDEAVKNFEATK